MHGRGRVESGSLRGTGGGFALTEVIVATIIAVVAAMGLAYTFSIGRVQIDRFKVARAAMAAAQDRMESLIASETAIDFSIGQHPASPMPFEYEGSSGQQGWTVEWVDDPQTSEPQDLKRVTVHVWWTEGAVTDTVQVSRLFLPQ